MKIQGWIRTLSVGAAAASGLLGLTQSPWAENGNPSAADPSYVLSGVISLPGGDKITSFDISFVDPVLNRLYFANRTSKALIGVDTTTNQVVSNFKPGFAGFAGNNNTAGPDGVVVVDHKEIWVGDAPSKVWVLDVNTGASIVPPISTGSGPNRADEMCYDPVDHIVAVVNNADTPPFITFISSTTKTVLGKIAFDGAGGRPNATNGAEQCQWNRRDGKIYLTLPEIGGAGDNSSPGGVTVIDPTTRAILRTMIIPLSDCTGPQGLAIGPMVAGVGQLGLGCNSSPTASNNAIINEATGATVRAFPNNGGCDMVWYNPGDGKYYAACRSAPQGESLFIFDAKTFVVQAPSTGKLSNAHSVAVDPIFNQAYVPSSSTATSAFCSQFGGVDANGCVLIYKPAAAPTTVYSAVTPNARTSTVNRTVTAFASIINASQGNATACSLSLPQGVNANFTYQTTNASNTPTGTQNAPANIPPGGTQGFFFAITPNQTFTSDIDLIFGCSNSNPTPFYRGLDTFLLTSAGGALPDMLSIADTQSHDGNLVFPAGGPTTLSFVTAAMNIGAAGSVTFTPSDTPFGADPRILPLSLTICQTDAGGNCLAAPTPSVTLTVANGQTVTFTVQVTRMSPTIPYVPAWNRLFVNATQGASPVGEASVAVKEQ